MGGSEDCSYYMKNQECKYGCTCKNNHPEMVVAQAPHPNMVPLQKPMVGFVGGKGAGKGAVAPPSGVNSKGYPIRPGATACSFFLKTGTCKFEATCQFTHPEGVDVASVAANPLAAQGIFSTPPAESFNSKGYPLRPGQPICTFFAKTGECKFSTTCKFDHTEGVSFDEAQNLQTNSLGHPLRPGQPVCNFYAKNGTCSFSGTCKFDHPEEYAALGAATGGVAPKPVIRAAATSFNSQGLPVRPGSEPCTFFLKTRTCSFGATCKYDHPEGLGGSQPGFQKIGVAAPTIMRAAPY